VRTEIGRRERKKGENRREISHCDRKREREILHCDRERERRILEVENGCLGG
jgi:hypothetical protein